MIRLTYDIANYANSRPLCSPEVILTVLHALNIWTFYCDSRRYFSYIVRCPSSHYWLYATLISSLMMMMIAFHKVVQKHPAEQVREFFTLLHCNFIKLFAQEKLSKQNAVW